MSFRDFLSGNFLKAIDLNGQAQILVIDKCLFEKVGQGDQAEHKWVLYFRDGWKPLVLNKTNATVMGEVHGMEPKEWPGKLIELYPTTTTFQGKRCECIRVQEAPETADSPF